MSFKAVFRKYIQTYSRSFIRRWVRSEEAVAAVEAALVFPILLTILLGVFDMGNAILANQKAIRSSQIVADLITRSRTVDLTDINEAIEGGRLAFETMSSGSYGVDIVSVRFDDTATPQIVWRETRGMNAIANVDTRVQSLAEPGNGVVMVAVEYTFEPLFAGFIIDQIPMQEIAFARGRKSAVVGRE